jgi:ribosomal protein S18 acetylase RimI-like enzyme
MAALGPLAMQPMTPALLESSVFSKPYFDRRGLIVATDDERILGFAHAGFGPNAERTAIDYRTGSIVMLVVPPHERQQEITAGLVAHGETYLRNQGATTILGGGTPSLGGFYLGLYGGADLPGILDSSPVMQRGFCQAGYTVHDRIAVMRRSLVGFRPPIDRLQLAIRRTTRLTAIDEPDRRNWWEAAVTTGIGLRRYELRGRDAEVLGSALFWDMQPMAASCGVVAAGLLDVVVTCERRRQGLAHYLVAEALHDLAGEGISVVEAHATESDEPAMGLLAKLGFEMACQGTLYRLPDDRERRSASA